MNQSHEPFHSDIDASPTPPNTPSDLLLEQYTPSTYSPHATPTSFPLATLNSIAAKPVPPAAPLTVTKSPFFIPPRTFKPNAAVQKLIPNEANASNGTVYLSSQPHTHLRNTETLTSTHNTLLGIPAIPRKQTVHAIAHIHLTRTVALNHLTTHLQSRNERTTRLLLVLPLTRQQV